jgi:hypothetical protein
VFFNFGDDAKCIFKARAKAKKAKAKKAKKARAKARVRVRARAKENIFYKNKIANLVFHHFTTG